MRPPPDFVAISVSHHEIVELRGTVRTGHWFVAAVDNGERHRDRLATKEAGLITTKDELGDQALPVMRIGTMSQERGLVLQDDRGVQGVHHAVKANVRLERAWHSIDEGGVELQDDRGVDAVHGAVTVGIAGWLGKRASRDRSLVQPEEGSRCYDS